MSMRHEHKAYNTCCAIHRSLSSRCRIIIMPSILASFFVIWRGFCCVHDASAFSPTLCVIDTYIDRQRAIDGFDIFGMISHSKQSGIVQTIMIDGEHIGDSSSFVDDQRVYVNFCAIVTFLVIFFPSLLLFANRQIVIWFTDSAINGIFMCFIHQIIITVGRPLRNDNFFVWNIFSSCKNAKHLKAKA